MDSLMNSIFDPSQLAVLAIDIVKGRAVGVQHLYEEAHHVSVQCHLQELEMESMWPRMSYTTVRSSRTMSVFLPLWKVCPMSCVRKTHLVC